MAFIIASPDKALCDLIANSTMVNLRYMNETERDIEEYIRLNMDAFRSMNADIFHEYIKVGKKAGSIKTILKLLERRMIFIIDRILEAPAS